MPTRNFCTTAELAAELGDADLGVIDASWHLPNTGRIGAAEFRFAHIPGAVFFDIDTIADLDQGLPHMLPKPDALAKAMNALGLGDGMRFVVYDTLGLFAAARVWWTLRAYGVEEVRILEGGLTRWIKEGRPLESGEARQRPPRRFTPRPDESFVATLDEVREALRTGSAQVVDARPADRFRGEVPEPRPGLRSGHMPGSLNVPFAEIVEHGRLKPPEALRAEFAAHKVDLAKPIITTCGSGVSAAILALAVEEAGGKVEGLYDGSWAEWGGRDDCQAVSGPA
jgi:thiosulfate/3-mercaptopyruvate sulfurtransferase